ncbi:MAG: M48 family metallopeptidase [Spirochaetales bacterium]|nr:M48 family metallopeptidase [Spirochaetales bacterium]
MSPESIRASYLALLALELAAGVGLNLMNMRHLQRLRPEPPKAVLGLMEPEEFRRSIDYTLERARLSLISSVVHAGALLLLVLTGLLGRLYQVLSCLGPLVGSNLAQVVFVYACSLLFALLSLPFSLYAQFVIEARYGFNRLTWRLWTIDTLKGLVVSLALMTPLLWGLFALLRATTWWWLWAFGAFAVVQMVLVYLYPKLIAPLFNRYTPLEEGPLKQRLHALAERLGVHTRGIYVVDGSRRSSHSNAYLSGFGRARRIVLFDTLIHSLNDAQVAAVLSHEIGHQKLRHVLLRILVTLVVVGIGLRLLGLALNHPPLFTAFGFAAPSPAAGVVLVLYFAGPLALLAQPLASWWSRRQEFRADRYAREVAGEGENLRQALVSLSRNNLSNPTPHPWYSLVYYSHPPLLERIRALERNAAQA